MGSMVFQLPRAMSANAERELERACVAGGQDGMPFPTHVTLEPGLLFVERAVHESGFLQAPWDDEKIGRLMVGSATLMERQTPYDLSLELARGKLNQLRNQMCEWAGGGLILGDELQKQITDATHAFGKAASQSEGDGEHAKAALRLGHAAARRLVETYIDQVFQVRHLRQSKLDTTWGCQVAAVPSADASVKFRETFNTVGVPISWREVEPTEGSWNWDELERRVAWAEQHGTVVGGPLIDFSGRNIPDWLWSRELTLHEISEAINAFADNVVRRYQGTIRQWRLTAASNWSGTMATNDEELIWLTVRLIEVIRRIDPQIQVIVGLCQPWGEYLASKEHNVTPFGFADTLLRTGVRLDALELECVMGVLPRGSYCRDPLDLSRMLDLYVLLGVPIHITVGYPSGQDPADANADEDLRPQGGHWGSGYTPADQASWAQTFGKLILCKPYVQSVMWSHWDDRNPHQFPYCGLVDAQGQFKPALTPLKQLRAEHLK